MKQFTLTLLRHGETVAPKSLNGTTDVELSLKGHQQMHDSAATLTNIDHISSSPLQRCVNVASLLAHQWKVPFEIHNTLSEMNFGDWDGETLDALYQKFPQQMDHFFNSPCQTTVPNGERVANFYSRVDKAWLAHIKLQKNALLVCHGGVIRYLIAKVLGMPLDGNKHICALKVDYAALVEINIIIDDEDEVWPTLIWPSVS
jgi:alpha-ribazole phosphatase